MRQCLKWLVGLAFVASDPQPMAEPVWPSRPDHGLAISGRVVRVVDGDTVEVELRRTVRVRLLDCWAPESRTKDVGEKARGKAAAKHLGGIVFAESESPACTIWIPADGEDLGAAMTLGRVLGHVWLDGDQTSLSERQVTAGHANRQKPVSSSETARPTHGSD